TRRQLEALERIAVPVDDLSLTVADRERRDADPEAWPGLGGPARDATIRAVRAVARVLRSAGAGDRGPGALRAAGGRAEPRQQRVQSGEGASLSSAGMTVAHSIRRALWTIRCLRPRSWPGADDG